jgi:hypothetical protein
MGIICLKNSALAPVLAFGRSSAFRTQPHLSPRLRKPLE